MVGRNPFDGIENEEIGGASYPYLRPANVRRDLTLPKDACIIASDPATYIVRIDQMSYKGSRNSGDFVLADLTVVHVENRKEGDGTNAPGSAACWQLMVNSDGFRRDFKTMTCNAMNFDPGQFTKALSERIISAEQPLTKFKRFARVTVDNIRTKTKGKDFTKHMWSPIEATFDAAGVLTGLNPPAIDVVAEYIRTKGEIKG